MMKLEIEITSEDGRVQVNNSDLRIIESGKDLETALANFGSSLEYIIGHYLHMPDDVLSPSSIRAKQLALKLKKELDG